jgi:hypothetical protein
MAASLQSCERGRDTTDAVALGLNVDEGCREWGLYALESTHV